jgi:hypothetical protein
MTTYAFDPTTTDQSVDWDDATIWAGGVVPNGADADVEFPIVYFNGSPYTYFVGIASGESVAVRSVALDDYLELYGALSVSRDLTENAGAEIDILGGTLEFGSLVNNGFDIQGQGEVQSPGVLTNDSEIIGEGLTISVAGLVNSGSLLAASGDLTVEVNAGGFTNLVGSTLTGGTYQGGPAGSAGATLYLNVGAAITTIAADVVFDGGDIQSYDPSSGQYLSLLSTVDEIAASGVLSIESGAEDWGALTDHGVIAMQGGTLDSTGLRIAADGQVTGYGTIGSGLDDEGTIVTGLINAPTAIGDLAPATLTLAGPVTGAGVLEVCAGVPPTPSLPGEEFQNPGVLSTLELGAAASPNVTFANNAGMLRLDDPTQFTGAIQPSGWGDQITLAGVSFSAITGLAFVGGGDGGTLTLSEADESLSLDFTGEFVAANFALAAGPVTLSTLPPTVVITVVAAPAGNYVDTAVDLEALSAGQISALAGEGVAALVAGDASVAYDSAQTAAIVAAGLSLGAPAGDFASETFADGSSEVFEFGAGGELSALVTTEPGGASNAYYYGPPGTIAGAAYADLDMAFAANGSPQSETFYDASGAVVASQSFAADGGYSLYVGGALLTRRTDHDDGAFDVEHCGAGGTVAGVAYANLDVEFSGPGHWIGAAYLDADGDVLATRTMSPNGGFTLEFGGVPIAVKTVDGDGAYQFSNLDPVTPALTSYQNDFAATGAELAHSFDTPAGTGGVNILGSGLEVWAASGEIGAAGGPLDFAFTPHADETYKFAAHAADDGTVFASGFGAATIKGFSAASGDFLDLSGLFGTFAAATSAITVVGADAVITDADHDTLTLVGVAPSSLIAANLGFG